MSHKMSMKLGFVGFICTPPKTITEPEAYLNWQIDQAAEWGCQVLHVTSPLPTEESALQRLKERIDAKGIEFELRAAGTFGLVGPDAASSRKLMSESIKIADFFGSSIIRCGYGQLNVETSRFNKKIPIDAHLQILIDNLKEAAKMVEDGGKLLAIENHCDFKGSEFVKVFDAVGSRSVGSALDTANGFTVFTDPNEDIEVLAPYAITTHLKDMRVWDYDASWRLIHMQPLGCAVGDGNVDIPRAIYLLDKHSPHAEGLHLVVELGWSAYFDKIPFEIQNKEMLYKSLQYIKGLLAQ